MYLNAITVQRLARRAWRRGLWPVAKLLQWWIFRAFNCALSPATEIGEGTYCAYRGIGVVIHERVRIGCRVVIGPQVTIGGRSGFSEVPVIEDDVYLGAGAKILGPVRVGARSVVGANAVVISDVPPGAVVAGVPAKIVGENSGDHADDE